ncbi:MAG: S8/S53 family peptidase [Chloroflexi bacterium]|nr:S8/S53 family peptidase [Chloroflexota bacterium]
MPEHVIRLRWPKIGAFESIEEFERAMSSRGKIIESFLEERSRDILPSAQVSEGAIPAADGYDPTEFVLLDGGAIPAPDGFDPTEFLSPDRPADVEDYKSGRGVWEVNATEAFEDAVNELVETNPDLVNPDTRPIGFDMPEPRQVELADGGAGPMGIGDHLNRLGIASSLYGQSDGSGVRISIIDSGLDRKHSEFKKAAVLVRCSYDWWRIQDPQPGKVVPIKLSGKKFETRHYHGTAVAGLVAGASSGVAPGASLIIHNVWYKLSKKDAKKLHYKDQKGRLHKVEVTIARIQPALVYSAFWKADIIVMSFSTKGHDPCFRDEISGMEESDKCLLVAASGNSGPGTCGSPGDYRAVLSVGATDWSGQPWKDTSVAHIEGANTSCLKQDVPDIWAPGVGLRVPVPKGIDPSGYIVRSGTSFAAPLVAGVAALVLGWYRNNGKPDIPATVLREHLLDTADDITLPPELGGGTSKRLNATEAVKRLKPVFPTS